MAESHINSLLPIKNRVLSVDEHTTFLAHYDLNEHDVLRGIKALGQTNTLDLSNSFAYVQAEHSPHLDATTQVTVEAWVYLKGYQPWGGIVSKGVTVGNYGIQLDNSTGKKLRFAAYPYADISLNGTADIPLNKWTHLAATYDAGVLTYYINGVLDAQGVVSLKRLQTNTEPLTIGVDLPGGDDYLSGSVAQVKIWNKALTQEEVKLSMGNRHSERGLLLHYRMDEGEGSVIQDSSAFHHSAYMNGTPVWGSGNSIFTLYPEGGKFGGAIAIESAANNLLPTPINFGVWGAYMNGNDGVITTEMGTQGLSIVNRRSWCGAQRGISLPSTGVYTLSVWVKVISRSSPLIDVRLYTNNSGQPDASVSASWAPDKIGKWQKITMTKEFTSVGVNVYLICFGGSNAEGFEVSAEYTMPQVEAGPIATSFADGARPSPALEYPPEVVNLEEGTFSMWFKPTNGFFTGLWNRVIGMSTGTNTNELQIMKAAGTNLLCFTMSGEAGVPGTGAWDGLKSTTALTRDEWYHIAATWSKAKGEAALYINGVREKSLSGIDPAKFPSKQGKLTLGYHPTVGDRVANSFFDELRIDRIARTDEEIMAWYQSNSPFWPRGIYRKSH